MPTFSQKELLEESIASLEASGSSGPFAKGLRLQLAEMERGEQSRATRLHAGTRSSSSEPTDRAPDQ